MSIASFSVTAGATGTRQVVINGVDLSDQVGGLGVVCRHGTVTKLTVELFGDGPIEGLGDVTIVRGAAPLAAFLANIDPEELERVALSRLEGLGDGNLTRAMLAVLAEWADPT